MVGIVLAIIGYAVGTAQVLVLDWVGRVRQHRQHLRLLRAELRRTQNLLGKFGWQKGVLPPSDSVPTIPTVSDQYVATVAATDFALTDEHANDNSQMSSLNLLDGLEILQGYHDGALESRDSGAERGGEEARARIERKYENAAAYDETIDQVAFQLDSALEDIERRLNEAGLRQQLRRVGRTLSDGENPPPLERGDSRLESTAVRTALLSEEEP